MCSRSSGRTCPGTPLERGNLSAVSESVLEALARALQLDEAERSHLFDSEEFRTRWAAHNVRIHRTGAKEFHHPVVGDLSLTYEMLDLSRRQRSRHPHVHRGVRLESAEALDLLASWTATIEQSEAAPAWDRP